MAGPHADLGQATAHGFLDSIEGAGEDVSPDLAGGPAATNSDSSADVGPNGWAEPVAELDDGGEDRFETVRCRGGGQRLAVAIEVPCGVPKVPGMVGTCERCLDVVVHSRGNAVDGVGFVQFAADDVRSVECFAEKAGGVDQQCGGREGDEELFGSCAIDALGILPDFVDEFEEGTSRPRV